MPCNQSRAKTLSRSSGPIERVLTEVTGAHMCLEMCPPERQGRKKGMQCGSGYSITHSQAPARASPASSAFSCPAFKSSLFAAFLLSANTLTPRLVNIWAYPSSTALVTLMRVPLLCIHILEDSRPPYCFGRAVILIVTVLILTSGLYIWQGSSSGI